MTEETLKELATGRTQIATAAGSTTFTAYPLQPAVWLKEIVDAAQNRWHFMDVCYVTRTQQGQKDIVLPYRTKYLGASGITYGTASPTDGTALTATAIDNLDGVTLTPTVQASRVSIANYALKINAVDLMRAAQDELVYSLGDKVDTYIATTIGNATSATSSATGAQSLYGGDATSDTTLAAGDVLTTDLVATARKLLMSKNKQYRASTGVGGGYGAIQAATIAGNPWMPSADEPFVLFIGPAQEEAFLKDSQFVNAAEYGGREALLNGEIGRYLGIKIVVTNNVEQVASGAEGPDAETANAGANMTRCIMLKAKRAIAFAWGQEPTLSFFDNTPQISKDVVLEAAYIASVVHSDAICFIDVADA